MTTLTETKEALEKRIACAERERIEAREREVEAEANVRKYRYKREEIHRHLEYLQARRRDLEGVETCMKGISP